MSWAYLLLDKLAGYLQYIARGSSGKAGRAILSDVVRGHFWFLIIDAQIAGDLRPREKSKIRICSYYLQICNYDVCLTLKCTKT